jgi:hypothetical protein
MLTTLPPSCADVMKSGNLNFLEPSGPFQACNGTALPIYRVSQKPPYRDYTHVPRIPYNVYNKPPARTDDKVKAKKAIPVQSWTGPEGSRRLRLPDFKTIGTQRWYCQPYAPAAFTPRGDTPGTHFC